MANFNLTANDRVLAALAADEHDSWLAMVNADAWSPLTNTLDSGTDLDMDDMDVVRGLYGY